MGEGVAGEFARGRHKHGLGSDGEFKSSCDLPHGVPAFDSVQIITEGKRPRGWISWARVAHSLRLRYEGVDLENANHIARCV